MALRATLLGATGFTGAELLRYLGRHPALALAAAGVRGEGAAERLPHLSTDELPLVSVEEAAATESDVCFSCLPSGLLKAHLERVAAPLIIDLADDFRASEDWVYGITEFARRSVSTASRIANPGCYPSATLLCLIPFVAQSWIEGPLIVDAMSGLSGAGRKPEDRLLHAVAHDNVGAYGTTTHRHVGEIENGLTRYGAASMTLSFTPHLVPLARGLLVTARGRLTRQVDDQAVGQLLRDTYADEPFVRVVSEWPQTKAVMGSNHALVSARVDDRTGFLIASCAIDNLGKGAAGQALQNANLALGLEETAGLDGGGLWP
ncbi:MAG: N-acetyl-gamma-glutamyl-phosphate reductase [Actinomycetota bacterium]